MGRNPYEERVAAANKAMADTELWLASIRDAVKTPGGRALVQWIFEKGRLHQNPFVTSAEVYRNCGMLEVAQGLRKLLKRALYDHDRSLFYQLTED